MIRKHMFLLLMMSSRYTGKHKIQTVSNLL